MELRDLEVHNNRDVKGGTLDGEIIGNNDTRHINISGFNSWVTTILVSVLSAGVIGFVNFVFITGRYSEKFVTTETRLGTLEFRVDKINSEGTYYSKSQLRMDDATIVRNSDRLDKIESLLGRVPVMQNELERMGAELKEQKQHKSP